MSTMVTPTTLAPTLSGLLRIQRYLNAVALTTSQGIAQVQADLANKDKVSAVNDAVLTAAQDVAAIAPGEAGNVSAALGLFATGESIFQAVVGLFHHANPPVVATSVVNAPSVSK